MSQHERSLRGRRLQLRIPMRGYEIIHQELYDVIYQLRIPMRGYECFKCGKEKPLSALRIPMRGYEILAHPRTGCQPHVTNPHEGL